MQLQSAMGESSNNKGSPSLGPRDCIRCQEKSSNVLLVNHHTNEELESYIVCVQLLGNRIAGRGLFMKGVVRSSRWSHENHGNQN